jgi:hypothetical protein
VWRIAVPAGALGLAALALAWHLHSRRPSQMANVPPPPPAPRFHIVPVPRRTEPPLIGYVLLPEGELRLRSAGEEGWRSVEGGDAIHLGDTLETEADASGSVVFLDGSDCRLTARTTLRYDGSKRADVKRPDQVDLSRGEAWFSVQKGGPTFAVRAPAATAVVHGTFFGVAVGRRGATTLRVKVGAVRLSNARGAVMVKAGLQSLALAGRPPQPPVPLVSETKPRPTAAVGTATQAAGAKPGAPIPGAGGKSTSGKQPNLKMKTREPGAHGTDGVPDKEKPEEPSGPPLESGGNGGDEATRMPVSTGP